MEHEKEGWIVLDDDYHVILNQIPPRAKSIYSRQIKTDLITPEAAIKLAVGFTFAIAGVIIQSFSLIFIAIFGFTVYLYMFFEVTRNYVNALVYEGQISELGNAHPVVSETWITKSKLTHNGEEVDVTISGQEIKGFLAKHSPVLVKILYTPKSELCLVLAVKRCA